jgi:transposase
MTNPLRTLINIPNDKGVHVKSAGAKGDKYVYKYTKFYRNQDGNPRNKATVIGKLDVETGRMIPNSNYYEMFNVTPELPEHPELSVWSYGYTYLVQKACKDLGLLACLQETFGDKTDEIVALAAYIIREGNAMDGIEDFQVRHFIPGVHKALTSQSCSRFFESITQQQTNTFFKKWVQTILKDDAICYGLTSVSSYSKNIPDVENGYNRDHEDLPQFNIGMFCCEKSKLPIYYNRYNGSLTDKTNLPHVLANAKSVGIDHVKLILDGGFMSEDCFKNLNNLCSTFTIGVPSFLDISKKMIEEYRNSINRYVNKLDIQEDIFCIQKPTSIYGVSGKLMLFFDLSNSTKLCQELSERITQLSKELSDLKRCPVSKLKRYEKYFVITKHTSDSGFDFNVDNDVVDQLRMKKGFFLLFSTDMTATAEDSLYFYRDKDSAEKLFDQMKVDMGCGRIRTHTEDTTAGKVFVIFIALAIRAYMLGKLKSYLAKNSTSLQRTLSKLENIFVIHSNGWSRFSKALTKQQKEILESFNATNDVVTSLDSCIR